jgi:hypothetical protein
MASFVARALWDFAGANEGDLPLVAGDVVVVTAEQEGGWLRVRARPLRGFKRGLKCSHAAGAL